MHPVTGKLRNHEDDNVRPVELTGKWQLTQIEYGLSGKIVSGQELLYQEVYEFYADSTFQLYQLDGEIGRGRYSQKKQTEGTFFHAKFIAFDAQKLLFIREDKAVLKQTKPDELVESHLAYDGPAYIYRRVYTEGEK